MRTLLPFYKTAGIYCPLISLKSTKDYGCGDVGSAAVFLHFLSNASWNIWQCGAISDGFGLDLSILDLHAIPYLTDAHVETYLHTQRLILHQNADIDKDVIFLCKREFARIAFTHFLQNEIALQTDAAKEFQDFCSAEYIWLDTYALNAVITWMYRGEKKIDKREKQIIQKEQSQELLFVKFIQWLLHIQMQKLYEKACKMGVAICPEIRIDLDAITTQEHREKYLHHIERMMTYADGLMIHLEKKKADAHISHAALHCIRAIANIMDIHCFPMYIDNYNTYKGILEELGFAKPVSLKQIKSSIKSLSCFYNAKRIADNSNDGIWENIKEMLDSGIKTVFIDIRDVVKNNDTSSPFFRMQQNCEEMVSNSSLMAKLRAYAQLSLRNEFDTRDIPRYFPDNQTITRYIYGKKSIVISVLTKDIDTYSLLSKEMVYTPKLLLSTPLYQFIPKIKDFHSLTLTLSYHKEARMHVHMIHMP